MDKQTDLRGRDLRRRQRGCCRARAPEAWTFLVGMGDRALALRCLAVLRAEYLLAPSVYPDPGWMATPQVNVSGGRVVRWNDNRSAHLFFQSQLWCTGNLEHFAAGNSGHFAALSSLEHFSGARHLTQLGFLAIGKSEQFGKVL